MLAASRETKNKNNLLEKTLIFNSACDNEISHTKQ